MAETKNIHRTRPGRDGLTDAQIDEAITLGLTRPEVQRRYGVGITAAKRVEAARRFRGQGTTGPRTRGKAQNWDGQTNATRQRQLKGRKKTDGYLDLLQVQIRISELCAMLEGVDVSKYGLDEVSLWRVNDIHDDLLSLAAWVDRTTGTVQGWLGDADIRAKIAILRDTTGRTEAEAENFTRLADKLEKKLRNRLIAG